MQRKRLSFKALQPLYDAATKTKQAHGWNPHACTSKCWPQFDEEILARWPRLWQRIAVMAFLALTMSGILPMAVATFQIWLGDTYGLWLTALCIVVDAAVIVWLVKRYA